MQGRLDLVSGPDQVGQPAHELIRIEPGAKDVRLAAWLRIDDVWLGGSEGFSACGLTLKRSQLDDHHWVYGGRMGTGGTVRRVLGVAAVVLTLASCSTGDGPDVTSTAAGNSAAATGGQTDMSMSDTGDAAVLLDPAEFATAMDEPGRVTINVHTPFEGKIDDDDLMIPYDQIANQLDVLPADRDTPLAVYCRSGNMSAIAAIAATVLAESGFTDIVDLRGGMQAWVADGRALITTE